MASRLHTRGGEGNSGRSSTRARGSQYAGPIHKDHIGSRQKAKVSCDKDIAGSIARGYSNCNNVEVRAARVTLRPRGDQTGSFPATVNVVLVREVNPPEGEEPVEWILLTSLPIDTIEQVHMVIQYYTVRWMVEVFFRTLKSGCRVEARRFETIDAFLRVWPCT